MKEVKGKFAGKGKKVTIVASSFNEMISKELVYSCSRTLQKCGVNDKDITLVWVPGAYEIPSISAKLAQSKKTDAVICLGAIIRGETPHFEYISSAVSRGISQVSLNSKMPVIFGIITADTQEQAVERAGIKQGNRGKEAALAALELLDTFLQIS